jgi:hypothetical protein
MNGTVIHRFGFILVRCGVFFFYSIRFYSLRKFVHDEFSESGVGDHAVVAVFPNNSGGRLSAAFV